MSDTQLNTLVINELTKAQYDALTPEANQLYMVTDEVPLDSSALLPYRTSANQDIIDATKVDKVTGKGLSTNDYTDADKQKVADAITSHQDISGKENISNKVTNISSSSTDTQYPSAKCVYDELAEANRKIEYLDRIRKGQGYAIDTDTADCYSASVPSGAFRDNVLMIGGKSVVFNQLVQNGNFTDTSGWNKRDCTISAINNELSITITNNNSEVYRTVDAISRKGHKLFIACDFYKTATGWFAVRFGNTYIARVEETDIILNAWNRLNIIDTMPSTLDVDSFRIFTATGQVIGDVVKVRNVMAIDLTQMFGAGNEPSTVAEFKAMFPADYYAYNTGEVKSASVNQVVIQGKNLCNGINQDFWINQGHTTYGKNSGSSGLIVDVSNYTNVTISTQISQARYRIGFTNTYLTAESSSASVSNGYTEDGTSYTFNNIATNGYKYLVIDATDLTSIQVELNSTATSYSPYTSSTISIPSAITSLDGYGWSAGSVYNYVDYANKKYHKRVRSYTFTGNETWSPLGVAYTFSIASIKTSDYNITGNIICAGMTPTSQRLITSTEKGIAVRNTYRNIIVYSSEFSSASDVATYMAGKTIYYELATEVITDISSLVAEDFLEHIEVEYGGTVTFKNSNGDDYQIPVNNTNEFIVNLNEVV